LLQCFGGKAFSAHNIELFGSSEKTSHERQRKQKGVILVIEVTKKLANSTNPCSFSQAHTCTPSTSRINGVCQITETKIF